MAKFTDPAARINKWNLKYDPARIKEITEAGKPTYLQNATTTFTSLTMMEAAVKQMLDVAGVSVIQYPFYLAFGREMWSKSLTFSGNSLAIEAAILIGKWTARGCTQLILESVRTQVFNVGPPPP